MRLYGRARAVAASILGTGLVWGLIAKVALALAHWL